MRVRLLVKLAQNKQNVRTIYILSFIIINYFKLTAITNN